MSKKQRLLEAERVESSLFGLFNTHPQCLAQDDLTPLARMLCHLARAEIFSAHNAHVRNDIREALRAAAGVTRRVVANFGHVQDTVLVPDTTRSAGLRPAVVLFTYLHHMEVHLLGSDGRMTPTWDEIRLPWPGYQIDIDQRNEEGFYG